MTDPVDRIERRAVSSLTPYAKNARLHSPEQIALIAASMREHGQTQLIICDDVGEIIAGHGRILAAAQLGLQTVMVGIAAGWTEKQKRAYRIKDNQLALSSTWDDQLLSAEVRELQADEYDLSALGFDSGELAVLSADLPVQGADPEAVPEPPETPVARPGDLWLLGKHRLLCGDATKTEDVERVLGNERADLCLTDPPYGVGLDYGVFNDTVENVRAIAAKWLPLIRERSNVVVFSPGITRQWLYPQPDWVVCWFYGGGQLRSPWGFNCWQPFLCYGKDPSLRAGRGARPDAVDMNTPANAAKIGHPCPKPMKLWQWLIERLSMNATEMIFDPFCGSGTTIIAAEMSARCCCAIEIDPAYVQVALERWQTFTGKQATLEGDGRSFDEIREERDGNVATQEARHNL